MRIAAIEPYAALSHRLFLEGLQRYSRHSIEILSLPAHAWKWRMRTAALQFAPRIEAGGPWDLLFVSDYFNLAELYALLPQRMRALPAVAYFHENQLTYPLQPGERRDHHFALIHLYSCLTSQAVLFNSTFHRDSFLEALTDLLDHAPNLDARAHVQTIRERSSVVPLGIDTAAGHPRSVGSGSPIVLWNHRWEYDKDPETFLAALLRLDELGEAFRVRVLGEQFRRSPPAFDELRMRLGDRIEHIGFLADRTAYHDAVAGAHITISTARHEFFGLGTLEAIRAGLFPVLPNDLAYPELLPETLRGSGPFLYERGPSLTADSESAVVQALRTALARVRDRAGDPKRRDLIDFTDRFHWGQVAPRFDAHFERAAAREIGPGR